MEVELLKIAVDLLKAGYVYSENGVPYAEGYTPEHIHFVYYRLKDLLNLS